MSDEITQKLKKPDASDDERTHQLEKFSQSDSDLPSFDGPVYEYMPEPQGTSASQPPPTRPSIPWSEERSADHSDTLAVQQAWKRQRKRRTLSVIGWVSGALLCIVLIYTLFSSALLQQNSANKPIQEEKKVVKPVTGTFEKGLCRFLPGSGLKEGQGVRCGYLVVPEDRSDPRSNKIRLAVAIFAADPIYAEAEPVVYLEGGPGGSLLSNWASRITSSNQQSFSHGHTLIMLDQRGTGYSVPSLDCPEMYRESDYQGDDPYLFVIEQCHERLTGAGVQVGAYTSMSNAADVHDLIHALGYTQANLYGVSYGTQLALTVMRLFPEDVRSVILDSPVPLQGNLFRERPFLVQNAYNTLFDGCAASSTCQAKYPGIEETFYQLIKRMNNEPITLQSTNFGPLQLNGNWFADFIYSMLYVTPYIPMLPGVISQVDKGDYSFLEEMYSSYSYQSVGLSEGLFYSVECGENMAYTSEEEIIAETSKMRPELKAHTVEGIKTSGKICDLWSDQKVPVAQKQPVVSTLPTLIFTGEYDPVTPPINGEIVHKTLSKSFLYTFPGIGHGAVLSDQCPGTIMSDFLRQPNVKPDTTCIAQMSAPKFQ